MQPAPSLQSMRSAQHILKSNETLSLHSNYRIGGPAKYFCRAETVPEIISCARLAAEYAMPMLILGNGTNILFSDQGTEKFVIKIVNNSIVHEDLELLRVGAGVLMSDLVSYAAEKGLSGLEWAGGLPGTFGGAIRGNAGAFRGEIKDSIVTVSSFDTWESDTPLIERTNAECAFGYRNSIFKMLKGREIILEAVIKLKRGRFEDIHAAIQSHITYRKERHPIEFPNVGSIFKNIPVTEVPIPVREEFKSRIKTDPFPVIPVACLISGAQLKGVRRGGAMISPKHPNFIVNYHEASCYDVKELIALVKKEVAQKYRIELQEEIEYA